MVSNSNNRTRRPGEHKSSAAVRARILETAFSLISKFGYSGTTMGKVATNAALPIGSVYWHFESKDLLLAAMIEESFIRWRNETAERNRPREGETFEEHVTRIFGSTANPKYFAADFWRLGVILSVEKSVPEQTARKQFLTIREAQRKELTSWWSATLSPTLLETQPDLPERLSMFTLAMQDGNAIAGSSGESLDDFQAILASCLIHLVSQARQQASASTESKKRTRAARTRS
ncbi:TetR/AcrR family transcriptional regulator [Bordetella avium]|nr:TetR/AcrR family transcriptional regulator [Bordetella avium]